MSRWASGSRPNASWRVEARRPDRGTNDGRELLSAPPLEGSMVGRRVLARQAVRFRAATMAVRCWRGAAVAVGMAFVLALLEEDFYYFFITPLIVSLPVLGAIAAVVYLGHLPQRGAARGLWWELGLTLPCLRRLLLADQLRAQRGRPRAGDGADRRAPSAASPGLPGYAAFRCKTARAPGPSRPAPPGASDPYPGATRSFSLAFLLRPSSCWPCRPSCAAIAAAGCPARLHHAAPGPVGLGPSEFRLPPETQAAVCAGRRGAHWPLLVVLPRIPAGSNPNTQSILFRVEYLPDAAASRST